MLFRKTPPAAMAPRVDRMEVKAFGAALSGEGWGLPALITVIILFLIAMTMGVAQVAQKGINVTVRVVQEPASPPEKPPPSLASARE
jgi:hypothetical protein